MGVWIGIDLGDRRVGVAVSDPGGRVALACGVLDGSDRKRLMEALGELAREKGAGGMVVGLPRNMDGSEGERATDARRFADELARHLGLPVDLQDERLTSMQAERTIRYGTGKETRKGGRPARKGGGRSKKEDVDRVAAVLILQAFLDRRGSSV